MHGARGQYKNTLQTGGTGALLDAFEHFFTVALALALRRYGQSRHFCGFCFGVGIQCRAGKDHTVMLNHGVEVSVAFDFGRAAFDQCAVFFKRLDQL